MIAGSPIDLQELQHIRKHVNHLLQVWSEHETDLTKAHLMMIRSLLAMVPTRIKNGAADADDLEARADHHLDLAQAVDDYLLQSARDTQLHMEDRFDDRDLTQYFERPFENALEGYGDFLLRNRAERMRSRAASREEYSWLS